MTELHACGSLYVFCWVESSDPTDRRSPMPKRGKTSERGYGSAYRRARARLLEGNPPCHWQGPNCTGVATTADHEPPMEVCGYRHLNLVPACGPCNFGRKQNPLPRRTTPSRSW